MICLVRWLRSFSVKGKLGMFAPRLVGWLAGWFVIWLVCWLVGWFVGWLLGWLVGRLQQLWTNGFTKLVAWSVGWLAVWLAALLGLLPHAAWLCLDDLHGLLAQGLTWFALGWLLNHIEAIFLVNIFNYKGFFCKIEVEHDFSGGLSSRVFLKIFLPTPNFIEIRIPYDFAIAS